MNASDKQLIRDLFAPVSKLNIWQWAEANVNYARAPSYDSDWKGPWRLDYMPYLKEPLEACTDPSITEVWCWACTRGGKSENLLLTTMRYMLATCPPYAMLYIGGQQEKVEQFYQKRILRGLLLSDATREMYERAKQSGLVREHTTDFSGVCDLIVSWAGNKQVAKGDSYPVIFADEVSSWPNFKADAMRERQATIPFPKLIGVSSADAESRRTSEEDPIIQEYENSDQRDFMMNDPKDGKPFQFELGSPVSVDGIKWDTKAKNSDGSWDYEAVENTAHYITPSGSRIDEKDRLDILSRGYWVPSAKCAPWKRGYRITRLMTPFPTGTFGNMARTFLESWRKQRAGKYDEDGRPPLRVYMYERLARKYYVEKKAPEQTEIDARKSEYQLGERMSKSVAYAPFYIGKKLMVILTTDVQKECFWFVLREWVDDGDSGLLDYGRAVEQLELRELGVKYSARGVLVDNSYEERQNEMIESASRGLLKGAFLCYGRDNIKDVQGRLIDYAKPKLMTDPYEGTAKQGLYKCNLVTFCPDRIKNYLYALTAGLDWHKWRVPRNISELYTAQMTSEQGLDGKWTKIRRDNHLWDCEVMQLLGCRLFGLWRENQSVELPQQHKQQIPPTTEPQVQTPTAVAEQKQPMADVSIVCPMCYGRDIKQIGASQYKCMTMRKDGTEKCRNVFSTNGKTITPKWKDDEDDDRRDAMRDSMR